MHGRGFCVHLSNQIRLDLLRGVFVLLGYVGPELVYGDTAAISCECYTAMRLTKSTDFKLNFKD